MFQTDASQFCLSKAKSDTGFDGFSTTQLHVVCKCALHDSAHYMIVRIT
ncbi:hypothetical protein D5S09_16050 [Lactobacillus sp. LMY-20]|uniref:Uncharacterized protein n=1 Tax=Lactiplantibacillus plantarum TaxID=1590 RepID=B5AZS4_LACPN|nr:hypothetical protein pLR1-01 [Lactiplantibacillus plantarum]KAB1952224.1 hypothetical protein F8276_15940 [Lactiplantibacillus plantarum]MCS6094199.1 hypothetical protein [Lactobacillus sp. LMY-20]MCT3241493.1 hypothetical protein [Lactiplantibacillus plantarum]RDF80362.1 hypothetical protein DQM22_14485 [Lactiplantibacillus plantarum]